MQLFLKQGPLLRRPSIGTRIVAQAALGGCIGDAQNPCNCTGQLAQVLDIVPSVFKRQREQVPFDIPKTVRPILRGEVLGDRCNYFMCSNLQHKL